MKVQLLLPLAIAVSVITVGVMKIRKKEHLKEQRKSRFQEIKLRVTYDVLSQYQNDKMAKQQVLETAEKQRKSLDEEITDLLKRIDTAKKAKDVCFSEKKPELETLDLVDKEFNELKASTGKRRNEWTVEIESLKKQLKERSPVCDFLKPDSQSVSKLCAGEAETLQANKEALKPENAKAEAPKAEADKEEAKEEAKAEADKKEAKAEAPKAEAPKEEAPKAEAPKAEEPKAEAPKEAKAEAPKEEAPKAEAPKAEAPKEAKAEAAKAEAPKADAPKAEAPKAEAPKAEAPKEEAKAEKKI